MVSEAPERVGLTALARYFLRLGTIGFGGPVALVGYMHRDLVERRAWLSQDDYSLGLALAQVMPGPLAAQLAMAIGFLKAGFAGATVVGLAFVLPSFLMVVGLAALYVQYEGLWWVSALFYTVGASVIAIIAIAAYKLSRTTNKRDPLCWAIFAVLFLATVVAQAELAELYILAGLLVVVVRARPTWLRLPGGSMPILIALPPLVAGAAAAAAPLNDTLVTMFFFFVKAGAFVFGSGLTIVPFLHQGVVQNFGWLNEHQFLDAVAVAIITPGPVVITVAFIGYLTAGLPGAIVAGLGMFLPVYLFTIGPVPWFKRNRNNLQLKAFVTGATAAATGAIAGAVVVLGQRAILDAPTALVALASLVILLRFKVPEPLVISVSGAIGLALWPLLGRV